MSIGEHGIRSPMGRSCGAPPAFREMGMRLILQLSIAAALAAGGELQAGDAADENLPAPLPWAHWCDHDHVAVRGDLHGRRGIDPRGLEQRPVEHQGEAVSGLR